MKRTCLLVRTTLTYLLLQGVSSELALEFALGHVDEKGPCSTFPYQSTRAARMPIMGLNLQIWTCRYDYDGLIGEEGPFAANLYGTSW